MWTATCARPCSPPPKQLRLRTAYLLLQLQPNPRALPQVGSRPGPGKGLMQQALVPDCDDQQHELSGYNITRWPCCSKFRCIMGPSSDESHAMSGIPTASTQVYRITLKSVLTLPSRYLLVSFARLQDKQYTSPAVQRFVAGIIKFVLASSKLRNAHGWQRAI